jgi:hypothetical protein
MDAHIPGGVLPDRTWWLHPLVTFCVGAGLVFGYGSVSVEKIPRTVCRRMPDRRQLFERRRRRHRAAAGARGVRALRIDRQALWSCGQEFN